MTRERGEQAVSEDERERLAQLAKAATPGPWHCAVDPHPEATRLKREAASLYGPDCLIYSTPRDYECLPETWERQRADARFIAAANPDTILRLLADRARLLAENARLEKVAEIRRRMIDIPTAWELARATKEEHHHARCSYRVGKGGFICDCAAFQVMEHVSGLLKAAHQRADAAEARVQALQEALKPLEHHECSDPNFCPAFMGEPSKDWCARCLAVQALRDSLAAAPSQGAGE